MTARAQGRALIALLLVLPLAACVSNSQRPPTSAHEAADANMKLGVAYMQQGNLALAKDKLERAEKQNSRNPELQTSLAYLYERLSMPEKAEAHYEAALRLDPANSQTSNNYAVYLCNHGKVDQALKRFEVAARDPLYSTPWAAWANAGVCLRSAKRGLEANKYLEQAIAVRPNYAQAVMELGDLQIEQGHPDMAENTVARFMSMGLATPEVLLVGLRAAVARGDKAATDNYARRLRRDFPNSVQARSLAQILQGKG